MTKELDRDYAAVEASEHTICRSPTDDAALMAGENQPRPQDGTKICDSSSQIVAKTL